MNKSTFNFFTLLVTVIVSISSVFSQSIWEMPQGILRSKIQDATFINPNTGWTVTYNGLIYKTIDGGNNWEEQTTHIETILNSVFFVDENKGFAVGDWGKVLKTVDGGLNWEIITFFESDNPYYDVFFIDEFDGWITAGDKVFHTSDGGENWSEILEFTQSVSNTKVFFISSQIGWALGDQIYATTNGGIDWTIQVNQFNFATVDIYFKDENIGFITSINDIILKTTNGGNTWQHENYLTSGFYNKMIFYDENLALFVSDNGILNKTTDGGLTWTNHNLNVNSNLRSAYFINETEIILFGDNAIYKSFDGALSWTKIASFTGEDIYHVDFASSNTLYAAGQGSILKSTDTGNSWENLNHNFGQYAYFADLDFVDDQTGWITDYNMLHKTSDGGQTWTSQQLSTGFNKIFMLSSTLGWITGGSKVYKTTDGINWNETPVTPNFESFNDIFFTTPEKGFITENTGKLYSTLDGGLNWSETNLSQLTSGNGLNNISFVNEQIGWIGSNPILKTTDGGTTWEICCILPLDELLAKVNFISELEGWIISREDGYGNIYYTNDGGNSWNKQAEGTIFKGLFDIKMYSSTQGIVVGSPGFIYSFNCENVPLQVNTFGWPSSSDSCSGNLSIQIDGISPTEILLDGVTITEPIFNYNLNEICPGPHEIIVSDGCGKADTSYIVIATDDTFIFNNPFPDSTAVDSLSFSTENCLIDYQQIDTAYIEHAWTSGNNIVHVIWVIESDGNLFIDTVNYNLNNGNGVYYLQFNLFCGGKSDGNFFSVVDAIYFNENGPSLLGIEEHVNINNFFHVYPNPTKGEITIDFIGTKEKIGIFNIEGKLILETEVEPKSKLNLGVKVETGIYFIKFYSHPVTSNMRIIVI